MSRSTHWQWFSKLAARTRKAPASARSLCAESLEERRLLAVFSVDNLDDSGPGSLREAIVQANAAEGPDEIDFRFSGTIELESPLPAITDSLTITGRGADRTTIDAGNGADGEFGTGDGFRIFDINDGDDETTIDVVVSGLTLTGGDTRNGLGASGFRGEAGEDGGAIRSTENLTLVDSVVTGNATGHGSDGELIKYCLTSTACQYGYYEYRTQFAGNGGRGGGVWVENANLTITRSVISGNRAGDGGAIAPPPPYSYTYFYQGLSGSGGGLGIRDGNLTITASSISGNATGSRNANYGGLASVSGFGGGVYATGFDNVLSVADSTISGNTGIEGGGVGLVYASANLQRSTISGNEAQTHGGGIRTRAIISGTLELERVTVSHNRVTDSFGYGGGVISDAAETTITASTITGNSATVVGGLYAEGPQLRVEGSLVAGNSHFDLATFANDLGVQHSLIGASRGDALVDGENGNQVGTLESPIDPLLGPLADNGGPTLTHALLANSPALNTGDPTAVAGTDGVPEFDQRGEGYTRVASGRIDIGAYEAPPQLIVNSTGDLDDGDLANGVTTLREAINAANGGSFTTEIQFDPAVFGTPQTIALGSQLFIANWLVITGPGADLLTLDAGDGADGEFGTGDGFRIFDIDDGDEETTIEVAISGVTLTGGDTLSGEYEKSGDDGGAIRSSENLTLVDSVVTGNAAGHGSDGDLVKYCTTTTSCEHGFYDYLTVFPGNGGSGGGIWVENANLTIARSTISGNRAGDAGLKAPYQPYSYSLGAAGGSGGGVGVRGGDLTITTSVIDGNASGRAGYPSSFAGDGSGGGVSVEQGGSLSITQTTVTNNTAGKSGGGIGLVDFSTATLSDSTISGNTSQSDGGGIGAPFLGDQLLIDGVTVSGNMSLGYYGAGIHAKYLLHGTSISRSTITGNTGGSTGGLIFGRYPLSIDGSILAGNGANDLQHLSDDLEVHNSLVGAYRRDNLVDGENGNQIGTLESPIDPRLAPLADNGGPTLTHALLPDSPALNAGDPAAIAGADDVPEFDQRGEGFSRVLDGRIDIGAFEGFVVDAPATRGDFNGDGVVDALDNEAWRASYGATVDPYTGADANGNGRIEAGDYTVWRDHFTPRDVDILRTTIIPAIDGAPDPLWESVPAHGIGNLVFGSVDSPSDASATWRAVWDETAIYLYAEIFDQRLIRDSSFAFEDDGLEAFFDADLSQQATYDGVDDTQYMFRLADSQPVASPDSPSDATENVVYATGSNPSGGGYTIEAAIPWTALNAESPLAGDFFGLEFALQDDDDGLGIDADGADGRLQWRGTSNQAFRRPSAFGVAALSPRFAQAPMTGLVQSEQETPPSQPNQLSLAQSTATLDEGFARLEPVRSPFRAPVRNDLTDSAALAVQSDLLLIVTARGTEPEDSELELSSQDPPENADVDEIVEAAFARRGR